MIAEKQNSEGLLHESSRSSTLRLPSLEECSFSSLAWSFVDENGLIIASASARETSWSGFISEELLFSGTNPDSTYTAVGTHKAIADLFDDKVHPIVYFDDYDFSYFDYLDPEINQPWWYYFLSPGFYQIERHNPWMTLGQTHDAAQVTITAAHPVHFH